KEHAGRVRPQAAPIIPAAAVFVIPLRPRFEHQIERCLTSAPETLEPSLRDYLAYPCFSSLRSQGQTYLLCLRCGRADQRRSGIVDASDGVEVLLQIIVSKWLHDHPRTIRFECLTNVGGCSGRISHVMKTIEEGHKIIVAARKILGGCDLEAAPVRQARF